MNVSQVKFYPELPWDDYLKTPGWSFSGIKNDGRVEPMLESEGMRIGKLVHTYLLKPELYDYNDAGIVVPIARELNRKCGYGLIRNLEKECAVTARFEFEGLYMDYKGLIDTHLKKIIVIDFKVLAGDLDGYIARFHYDHQLIGYGAPVEAKQRLIIAFNKKTKLVQTKFISYDPRWWQYQIKKYGKSVAEYNQSA